ncbi:MAG: ABC transporter substrate-binding protein [Caldilineaceae bacterium]|nr:ABC transporter substrate-binding protein [Caldilineaceae bacterium]
MFQQKLRLQPPLHILLVAVLLLLAACGGPSTSAPAAPAPAATEATPESEAAAPAADLSQLEAPLLAEKVAAGELPPLEERLPVNPLVVEPYEAPGQYGGTWKIGVLSPRAAYMNARTVTESLAMWDRTGSQPVPDIAESWEISEDGTTYTFHLREGMKWSDGEPFTSADILFWFNDIIMNTEYTPAPPDWLKIKGEVAQVSAPDDYTVVFTFAGAYSLFLPNLAFRGTAMFDFPAHYISQFHPAYVEEAELTAKIAELGYETWNTAILDLAFTTNPDLPRLSAWVNTTKNPETSALFTRNPYYWKVDTEGRQLPYMDTMEVVIYQDREVMVLGAMNGEINYEAQVIAPTDYPVLSENEERGGYTMYRYPRPVPMVVFFNMDSSDPVLGPLVKDKRFRIALSVGVDREDINQSAFLGLGEITQGLPPAADPYSIPELNSVYTEYDPDEANRLLDELGLDQRDSEGFRLTAAGTRLSFTMPVLGGQGVADRAYEILAEYWRELGIEVAVNFMPSQNWVAMVRAGEHVAAGYLTATVQWVVDPIWFVPTADTAYYAPLTGLYYATNGEQGVEPEGDLLKLQQLFDEMKASTDPAEQVRLGQEIVQINADNLFKVGFVQGFQPVLADSRFHNIPHEYGLEDYRIYFPRYMQPEQWWLAQE